MGVQTRARCSSRKRSYSSPMYVNAPGFRLTRANLFGSQYSTGVIAKFPVSDSPPYLLAASPSRIKLEGSSINPERQESSHPHQIFYHPHGEVLVPDLGVDLVRRYKITDNGSLLHAANIPYTPGGGPRHVAFHGASLYSWIIFGPKERYHRQMEIFTRCWS